MQTWNGTTKQLQKKVAWCPDLQLEPSRTQNKTEEDHLKTFEKLTALICCNANTWLICGNVWLETNKLEMHITGVPTLNFFCQLATFITIYFDLNFACLLYSYLKPSIWAFMTQLNVKKCQKLKISQCFVLWNLVIFQLHHASLARSRSKVEVTSTSDLLLLLLLLNVPQIPLLQKSKSKNSVFNCLKIWHIYFWLL